MFNIEKILTSVALVSAPRITPSLNTKPQIVVPVLIGVGMVTFCPPTSFC